MAYFNTESRLVGGKLEAVSGQAENLTNADFNVRVREADLSNLEVVYSDSSKYLTGDHTHSTVVPGLARATIDQSIQFAVGEFIVTGDDSAVEAATLSDGGSATALTPGTYDIADGVDFTTNGIGTGLVLTVTVDASSITSFDGIVNGGINYSAGETITVTQVNGEALDVTDGIISIDSVGANIIEQKIPYGKYLESAGLVVNAVDPTVNGDGSYNEDGYWEFYPEKAADCKTITEALYDISTCDGGSTTGVEYKIKGAVSTLNIESTTAGAPFNFKFSTQGAVDDVKEVSYSDLPVFDDAVTLNTPSARMLNTDIIVTEVNGDGSAITPNILTTYKVDGSTPQPTFDGQGNAIDVYDVGYPITVYDGTGTETLVYDNQGEIITPKNGVIEMNFCSNSLSLDTGNGLGEIQCQADAFGIKQQIITSREPMINISPLLEKMSDWDFWGGMTNERVYKIEITNYEDSAKTKPQLSIVAPRAQLISVSGTDDSGFRRLDQQFRLLRNVQGATPQEREHDYVIRIYGVTIDKSA